MAEMSCVELVELVTEYLDDRLDAEARKRFEAHLAECEGCSRYLDQFRETIRQLGALPLDTLSAGAGDTLPEGMRDSLIAAFRDWRRGDDATPT